LACLRLRDRDAIVTREGLIFRVFGYTHPPDGFICDAEYAPSNIFKSANPKAYRTDGANVFYKFYEDEGWRFIEANYPQYMLLYEPIGRKVVGVKNSDVASVRKPEQALKRLIEKEPKDELLEALQKVLEASVLSSGLSIEDFGVFGSLLQGFYHPKFSDIDIIVYGRKNLKRIRKVLQELYNEKGSGFSNEFEDASPIKGKAWRFKNISPEEFIWHQRRKTIYGVFHDKASKRAIKVEFEPVKGWSEISNEYNRIRRIFREGWVKALLRIKDDLEAPFMPSIYHVETVKIVEGPRVDELKRIVSYLEEFRMQAWNGEMVYAEGNLERVELRNGECFHQITLTYGPRYYEQVLKVAEPKAKI